MDDESFAVRWKRRPKPQEILATLSIASVTEYFTVEPEGILPPSAPIDWSKPDYDAVKVAWRTDITELERRGLEAQMLPRIPYRERVDQAQRPEEVLDTVHDHIWVAVKRALGYECSLVPGTCRAARHNALWSQAARRRHILRLRTDSLRGGTARL